MHTERRLFTEGYRKMKLKVVSGIRLAFAQRRWLVLLSIVLIVCIIVSALAISGIILTWEKTFEVENPEIECEIEVGNCRVVGCPVNVWVCLKLGDECEDCLSEDLSDGNNLVVFEDDFESYDVGTFPYSGGWELWTNGAGNAYQAVVDDVSMSPSKSLQLRGQPSWVATASKRYTTDSIRIGFEVYVRAKESGGARVGFTKWVDLYYIDIRVYSGVLFSSDGKILLDGYGELEPWVAGEWYKVKQVIDRSDDTCSVWINDVLRASDVALDTNDVPGEYHYNETEAFSLISSYETIDAHFDNVKIFEVETPPPPSNHCQVNGIFSVNLHWWNESCGEWNYVKNLQEETNISLTCSEQIQTYMFIPQREGRYKVIVTLVMDSEMCKFTSED